jgi:hypothetical protein
MVKKRIVGTAIALGLAAGAFGVTTNSASAAHFGFFFGVPEPYLYYPPPPPPRSCWQWSPYYQTWVWACPVSHPLHDRDDFRRYHRDY